MALVGEVDEHDDDPDGAPQRRTRAAAERTTLGEVPAANSSGGMMTPSLRPSGCGSCQRRHLGAAPQAFAHPLAQLRAGCHRAELGVDGTDPGLGTT